MDSRKERRTRTVFYNGKWVQGTPLTMQTSSEPWSEYLTSDGSIVRAKCIVLEVTRVDGEYTPEGEPVYACKSQIVHHTTFITDDLCRRPT